MADANSTQTQALNFTVVRPLYQFCPVVTILNIRDQLAAKQAQLNAMLLVGAEVKDYYSESTRDYFWACRATAEEIAVLTGELTRRMDSERTETA